MVLMSCLVLCLELSLNKGRNEHARSAHADKYWPQDLQERLLESEQSRDNLQNLFLLLDVPCFEGYLAKQPFNIFLQAPKGSLSLPDKPLVVKGGNVSLLCVQHHLQIITESP